MPGERFVQFVPLLNFDAQGGARLELDADTWIDPLPDATRAFVVAQLSRPDVMIGRDLLETLRFGLFNCFQPPDASPKQAPDQGLELDARLVFKILKPDSAVTIGYSACYPENGDRAAQSRRAATFPATAARYELSGADAARLPALWRELRKLLSPAWLQRARFLQTARARLWRASHEPDQQQRLVDLFIAMESVLLRNGERWAERGRSVGGGRLAVLLDPKRPAERGRLYASARLAAEQRDVVVHGSGKEPVGFDADAASFEALVGEVERWATVAVHRMLRILFATGSLGESLELLDAVATDPVANARTVRLLLGG